MDASSNVTAMLTEGDLRGILDSLSMDQREDFVVVSPVAGTPDGVVTFATVGKVNILFQPNDTMDVHAHKSAERARRCWDEKVIELREMIDHANRVARRAQQDPRAQALLRMGAPPDMIVGALMEQEQEQEQAQATMLAQRDLPPVGQVPVSDTGPTGFYL
jgi:hypothetical protein